MLSTRQLTLDYGPTTRFGVGAIAVLPQVVARLGHRRAFLVTDDGIAQSRMLELVQGALGRAGIETRVFDGVRANPSTGTLDAGGNLAREWGHAAVVAVGGGSV